MYDHYGAHISTQTMTIDSSQFGTNYTEWSLNNKLNDASTGRPILTDMAGFWNKTLTTTEREVYGRKAIMYNAGWYNYVTSEPQMAAACTY